MKILSALQSRQADKYTIENEPVSSLALMERAAEGLCRILLKSINPHKLFIIFCGKGNNGGDGLTLARLLNDNKRKVKVYIVENTGSGSEDFTSNHKKLQQVGIDLKVIHHIDNFPDMKDDAVIIDAIFGSGLNRPADGLPAELIDFLNRQNSFKVAIDIPSGLFADDNKGQNLKSVFKANLTLTIQQPKLCFFHHKTAPLVGEFKIIDIHLHPDFLDQTDTNYHYVDLRVAQKIYKPRNFFSYKNKFGHALLIAGTEGKMGAAMLSAKGAMHAGAGLLTVFTAKAGLIPLQSYLPEAMVIFDENRKFISQTPDLMNFTSVAMGPGIGQNAETAHVLKEVLGACKVPLILDADALNVLAENKDWLKKLPLTTILTPHIGEYKRLLNKNELGDNYLEELKDFCMEHKVFIVLKDAISTIGTPEGKLYFVKSGSPALATAGTGDTLSGILAALAGAGYSPLGAVILGVWMHGRAGKLAGDELSEEATLAGDVSLFLGKVFKELRGED